MKSEEEDEPRPDIKDIPAEQLKRVWLTVVLMLLGGCLSALLITLAISWAFGLKIHLPG